MENLKLRAWDKVIDQMFVPDSIHFDLKGNAVGIGSKGTVFGIEDFELMQSTGLHDKNGKEIFEGDIIGREDRTAHDWYISLHQIIKNDCGLMGKQLCSSGSYIGIDFWTSCKNPLVVVGNIHENPELLEAN